MSVGENLALHGVTACGMIPPVSYSPPTNLSYWDVSCKAGAAFDIVAKTGFDAYREACKKMGARPAFAEVSVKLVRSLTPNELALHRHVQLKREIEELEMKLARKRAELDALPVKRAPIPWGSKRRRKVA